MNIEAKGWSALNKPENVQIYDIFTLQDGRRVIIEEIRKIKRHGVYGDIWEFVDRDTGYVCQFNEFEWLYDEDL